MKNNLRLSVFAAFALLALTATMLAGARSTQATDEESTAHPAHIHSGTCQELGDVVFPLNDVSPSMPADGSQPATEHEGAMDDGAIPVAVRITTVDSALADLLASPHAVNIHESAANIGNYIACGAIGGTMMGSSDLAIGLGELGESGYSGIATFHDNGDGTTVVSVYLTESYGEKESGEALEGTAAAQEAGTAVAVDISNLAYNPPTLEIEVGDTVTWTNNDTVPHTVTQKPSGSGFQSGTLKPGESFSFTFDTAGTFDYYCEFHAGMAGQVIVS